MSSGDRALRGGDRPLSDPSFVYFDLDDTLLDHGSAERAALVDLHRRFPNIFANLEARTVQQAYARVNADVWHRYGAGSITKERARLERFELLLDALPAAGSPERLSTEYMRAYGTHWSYLPGAKHAYSTIAARTPVGILTNGFAEVQHDKLRRFPDIERLASSIVISEEVGFMKPDQRIFDYAAERAGVEPSRILYIGDSYRSDVLGGMNAGWRVARLSRKKESDEVTPRFEDWDSLLAWFLSGTPRMSDRRAPNG